MLRRESESPSCSTDHNPAALDLHTGSRHVGWCSVACDGGDIDDVNSRDKNALCSRLASFGLGRGESGKGGWHGGLGGENGGRFGCGSSSHEER